MSLTIQLLGRPRISKGAGDADRFRSRKSWGLLAYLMLSERPPTRSQAALDNLSLETSAGPQESGDSPWSV